MFRFMEKYRVHILLVVLLAMVGFGAWAQLVDLVGRDKRRTIDPEEVYASLNLFGEKLDLSRQEVAEVTRTLEFVGSEDEAGRALGQLVRQEIAQSPYGYPVSKEEQELGLNERFKEPIQEANDGRFDQKLYEQYTGQFLPQFGLPPMTRAKFEARFLEECRLAKTMREIDRAGSEPDLARTFAVCKKDNMLVKLRGIFVDAANFKEQAKLARDANDNLTAEALTTLRDRFEAMDDEQKRALATKGPMVSVDFIGYDFANQADDQAFLDDYRKVSDVSGKSLEQLCAEVNVGEADVAIMKERLNRRGDRYGLAEGADVEAVWNERKERFEAEIKVIKFVRNLWTKIDGETKAGHEVDLAQVAADNNLTHFTWKKKYLRDLVKEGSSFQGQDLLGLQGVVPGQLLDVRPQADVASMRFGTGASDVIGRHVAIYRVTEKEMRPLADFGDPDIRQTLIERYETERGNELRDEAFAKIQDAMNAVMDEKAKDKIAELRGRFEKEIAEATAKLDPEKDEDKAEIERITKEKNEELDLLIEDERAPFRTEAFDALIADHGDLGLVVEEGFFRPFESTREQPIDRMSPFEARARSSLRREFRSLHDEGYQQKYVEIGQVSDVVDSPSYPGLKGIAKLIAKKEISDRQLALRPELLRTSKQNALSALNKERGQRDLWGYESMQKRNFALDPGGFAKGIEQKKKDEEAAAERQRKFKEEQERMLKERGAMKSPDEMNEGATDRGQRSLSTTTGGDK
ncbi:MAG: hypothetical protein H6807_05850 [Planctomycetes bacterium]|nr:hypothetical protein [Planctomycetota bacterium]